MSIIRRRLVCIVSLIGKKERGLLWYSQAGIHFVLLFALTCARYGYATETGRSEDVRRAALDAIASDAKQIATLYVEYDVYGVVDSVKRTRRLSVIEATDGKNHYSRIVHWYDSYFYDLNGSSNLDQALNWCIWSPEVVTQYWETTRQGIIARSEKLTIDTPFVRFYSEFIGRILPQQTDVLKSPAGSPAGYSAKDYYLPSAVCYENWELLEDNPNGLVKMARKTEGAIDSITVDKKLNFAIVERRICGDDGTIQLYFSNKDFIEPNNTTIWLPAKIVVHNADKSTLELDVKTLRVNQLPESIFKAAFLPGSIIKDELTGRKYITPGGKDLIDLTLERMRLTLQKWGRKQSHWGTIFIGVAVAVVFVLSIRTLRLRYSAPIDRKSLHVE